MWAAINAATLLSRLRAHRSSLPKRDPLQKPGRSVIRHFKSGIDQYRLHGAIRVAIAPYALRLGTWRAEHNDGIEATPKRLRQFRLKCLDCAVKEYTHDGVARAVVHKFVPVGCPCEISNI